MRTGDLLWVEHDRYDSATARWVAVPDLDGHQVTVVGAAPAAVVGWVDRLERVCVVDRRTLRATRVEGPLADAPTSPPIVTGHDDSTIFLRSTSGGVWYALDTDERRLSAFRTSALPRLPWGSPALLDGREYLGFDRGWATHPNSRVAGFHGVITPLSAIGTPQIVIGEHFWFASSWSRANGFVYTQASESSPRRLFGPAGGLYRLSLATGELEQLAPRFDGHTLADETVVVALEDCTPNSDTVHLVGRHGVSRLLVDGRVEEWSTYADGLATDWLFAATCVNGRLVVWSDRDSGRGPEERAAASVLEPGSGLWMPFASPGSLRRDGGSFAAWLDLEDRAVHLPALPKFERDPCRDSGVCMPVLGGIERGRLSIGDQVLRYGNHGAVLAPESLQVELLTAPSRSVLAPGIDWRSRAHRARAAQYGQVRSPAELAPYLADANPFVQAEGVSRIHPMFLDESFRPLLERCVRSTCPRLQYTALVELGKLPAEGSADLYYDLVGGEDPRAKAWAAVKLGELLMPGIDSILRDLVDAGVDLDPWPYGSTGDQKTGFRYHLALALRRYRCADDLTRILPLLPVFARPEFEDIASEVIRDPRLPWSLLERVDNPPIGWITLAGPDALPLLHHAVASRDRIVRANAARCLADLRDPSSVGPLLQALEQPSGLARREIVVALGKLRAREAMPALVDLYRAVEDEHRPGVMASQVMARTVGEMEGLNSLSELSSGLDAFGLGGSRSLATDQVCPKGFQLLDLRCILEAAVMIGGRGSAELFALAAAGSAPDRSSLRLLAARGLDLPSEEQSPEAAAVLRALLQDDDSGVAVAAAVSLLNCGSTEGMRVLEHEVERAVSIDHPLGAVRVLEEMLRVRDPAHLDPFLDLALALRAQPDDRLDSRRYVIHRFIAKTR